MVLYDISVSDGGKYNLHYHIDDSDSTDFLYVYLKHKMYFFHIYLLLALYSVFPVVRCHVMSYSQSEHHWWH
jgi:hypothetical protein